MSSSAKAWLSDESFDNNEDLQHREVQAKSDFSYKDAESAGFPKQEGIVERYTFDLGKQRTATITI